MHLCHAMPCHDEHDDHDDSGMAWHGMGMWACPHSLATSVIAAGVAAMPGWDERGRGRRSRGEARSACHPCLIDC
jgi:hypothetical protein